MYLHYTRTSILTKGPYSQYLKLRCICTLDQDFKDNAYKLTRFYLKRGYPLESLRKHFQKANSFSQDQVLEVNEKRETKRVMVTTFSPKNLDVSKLIRDNWNILQNTEELTNIFPNKPIMGFRRLPNLRDRLTSAKIRYPPIKKPSLLRLSLQSVQDLFSAHIAQKLKKLDNIQTFFSKKNFVCKNLPPKHQITCE